MMQILFLPLPHLITHCFNVAYIGIGGTFCWQTRFTLGLNSLLQACRQGGNVTCYPDQSMRIQEFTSILLDVLGDFTIP